MADAFRPDHQTGKRFTRLLEIACYLVFFGYTALTVVHLGQAGTRRGEEVVWVLGLAGDAENCANCVNG